MSQVYNKLVYNNNNKKKKKLVLYLCSAQIKKIHIQTKNIF